ncbi:hypothetical protein WN51_00280 [Melipona quadrifasciata]|uniref:Histone-lysine N-methyltransferase SETMAR n=1 Tax=Melipona quadrifasciata TaxID=166423 RepID=A0A0M9A003_9HYME|nr:hypothetical protein WN51_00280 [Melipona quadrifasciata]
MKYKLRGNRILSLKALVRHMRERWRALPVTYAEKLVESMPRQCQTIIGNGGDWIDY